MESVDLVSQEALDLIERYDDPMTTLVWRRLITEVKATNTRTFIAENGRIKNKSISSMTASHARAALLADLLATLYPGRTQYFWTTAALSLVLAVGN